MSKALLITNAYNRLVFEALEQKKYDTYVLSCMSPLNADLILKKYPVASVYDIYTFLEHGDPTQLDDFYIKMMETNGITKTCLHPGRIVLGTRITNEHLLEWVHYFEGWHVLVRPGAHNLNIPKDWVGV